MRQLGATQNCATGPVFVGSRHEERVSFEEEKSEISYPLARVSDFGHRSKTKNGHKQMGKGRKWKSIESSTRIKAQLTST